VGINEEALMTMGINLTEAGTIIMVAVNRTGERGTLRIVLDKNIEGDLHQEITIMLETMNAIKKVVVDEETRPTGTIKGATIMPMVAIETIVKVVETETNKLAKEELLNRNSHRK